MFNPKAVLEYAYKVCAFRTGFNFHFGFGFGFGFGFDIGLALGFGFEFALASALALSFALALALALAFRPRQACRKIIGSSTAVVVALDGVEQELRAVNLGDSGVLVFRWQESNTNSNNNNNDDNSNNNNNGGWKLLTKSQEQFHTFNCPFQVWARVRNLGVWAFGQECVCAFGWVLYSLNTT